MDIIGTIINHVVQAARVMVPTFGVAAVLVMSRKPELWSATEADGATNWLPFLAIACLTATLVELVRMRGQS